MNSQQLWFLGKDLQKIKPINILPRRGGTHEPPFLTEELLTADDFRGR